MRKGKKKDDLRVSFQSVGYDGEGVPALCLHVPQPFRRDVFLKERGDAGVEVRAEGAQWGRVVAAAIGGWRLLLLDGAIDGG